MCESGEREDSQRIFEKSGVASPPSRLRILLRRPARLCFPCTGVRGMPRTLLASCASFCFGS